MGLFPALTDIPRMNALQIVPSWVEFFDDPQGSMKGIITASYPLGAAISLPIVPWVNNRFGRRWSIFIGSVIMCIGAIIQCTAQSRGMYIGSRIVLGFGIPMSIVAGAALVSAMPWTPKFC
jgi:MFS family permease